MYEYFEFDTARNDNLSFIRNADIYFQIDLDEYISTKDWKTILLNEFTGTRGTYNYVFSWKSEGVPDIVFNANKIHTAKHRWHYPIHEILTDTDNDVYSHINITVEHHTRDKTTRNNYLDMLKHAYETRKDDRIVHYYGRELFFAKQYDAAIDILYEHTQSDGWNVEKGNSCRYIAECYIAKNDLLKALEYSIWALSFAKYAEFIFPICVELHHKYNWLLKHLFGKIIWEENITYTSQPVNAQFVYAILRD